MYIATSTTHSKKSIFQPPDPKQLLSIVNFDAFKIKSNVLQIVQPSIAPLAASQSNASSSQHEPSIAPLVASQSNTSSSQHEPSIAPLAASKSNASSSQHEPSIAPLAASQSIAQQTTFPNIPALIPPEKEEQVSASKCVFRSFAAGVQEEYLETIKAILLINEEEYERERNNQQNHFKGNEKPWYLFEILILQAVVLSNRSSKVSSKQIAKVAALFLKRRESSIESALRDHYIMKEIFQLYDQIKDFKSYIEKGIDRERLHIFNKNQAKLEKLIIKPQKHEEMKLHHRNRDIFDLHNEQSKKRQETISRLQEKMNNLLREQQELDEETDRLMHRIRPKK